MTTRAADRHQSMFGARLSRRNLMMGGGTAGLAAIAGRHPGFAQTTSTPPADHTIRIAPVSLEIAPSKVIKTTGYNGAVPGPLLRLQEGKPVAINVINNSGYPNLIHWHGLFILAVQDGATEEGSPLISPGAPLLYSFHPNPTGTRCHHRH